MSSDTSSQTYERQPEAEHADFSLNVSLDSTPRPGDRLLALAAGDLHGTYLRRAMARFNRCNRDLKSFIESSLADFEATGRITAREFRRLREIVQMLSSLNRESPNEGERLNLETVKKIERIYQMLVDDNATPFAIGIAGIALDSGRREASADGEVGVLGLAVADIAGGILGGEVGGIPGMIAGGFGVSWVVEAT